MDEGSRRVDATTNFGLGMTRPGKGVKAPPDHWRWPRDQDTSDVAMACLASGLAAVDPAAAVVRALEQGPDDAPFTRLVALGKAALPMALAADSWQHRKRRAWDATLVVCPPDAGSRSTRLTIAHGEHPVPGHRSVAAAAALNTMSAGVGPNDRTLLLLSGGTTSLVAAPVPGVSLASLQQIFRMLLASGLDIHAANRVRKQFLAWGGGRLAEALAPGAITALAISDVPGDDPASIGSGPVSPDSTRAGDVQRLLATHRLELPGDAGTVLQQMVNGKRPETPKPGTRCFRNVHYRVVASNRLALEAAAAAATAQGFAAIVDSDGLSGEASVAGPAIARRLLSLPSGGRHALIFGGETTVTLGPSPGIGGRNQELALAAARELDGSRDLLLLAAGTDGHDGGSDNAGAMVDGTTWGRIPEAGALLAAHASEAALERARAGVRTGPTGTNVMDLVIALRW